MKTALPHVSVVLLNWCAAPMTTHCLESVLASDYGNFSIVVCDNASTEHGIDELESWARGEQVFASEPAQLAHLTRAQNKPLTFRTLDRASALAGGATDDPRLVFIQTGENRGYAAGNNVGINYVLARQHSKYVWLLNTDTLIAPDALSALVARAEQDQNIGMTGSTLVELENPTRLQTCGGARYRKSKGDGAQIGSGLNPQHLPTQDSVEKQLDFVIAASMLVRTDFIRKVGLICEDYFLYCEEMDWAIRGRLSGYKTAWAPNSTVYHSRGGSTPSFVSSYFFYRNTLIFARRFFPLYFVPQYFHLLKRCFKAWRKKEHVKVRALAYVLTGRVPSECARFISAAP